MYFSLVEFWKELGFTQLQMKSSDVNKAQNFGTERYEKKCIPFRLRPQLLKECYNLGEGKMLLSKQASPIVSV
jgi:hypothetical protein